MKKNIITDRCPTPYDAMRAMVEGLRTIPDEKTFFVNMGTFGDVGSHPHFAKYDPETQQYNYKVCFGCAATCTLQQLFNIRFEPTDNLEYTDPRVKAITTKIHLDVTVGDDDYDEIYNAINEFESAMDLCRLVSFERLFNFYEVDIPEFLHNIRRFSEDSLELETSDYKAKLRNWDHFIDWAESNHRKLLRNGSQEKE